MTDLFRGRLEENLEEKSKTVAFNKDLVRAKNALSGRRDACSSLTFVRIILWITSIVTFIEVSDQSVPEASPRQQPRAVHQSAGGVPAAGYSN